MARIYVDGWIAEGGCKIISGPNGNILLFDLVENNQHCNGIDSDVYRNNNAWYHCSMEVIVKEPEKLTIVPDGHTLQSFDEYGYARILKDGTSYGYIMDDPCLTGEYVADFIQEATRVRVSGQEILLQGEDGKLLRVIKVSDIDFNPRWVKEEPRLMKVPYKSDITIYSSHPQTAENN